MLSDYDLEVNKGMKGFCAMMDDDGKVEDQEQFGDC